VRYEVRVPLRIDLGGWWTDASIYADREGGKVLCAAISLYARGYISRPASMPARAGGELARRARGDRTHLAYAADVPPGARLGLSAAQTVLWIALVRSGVDNSLDRREIAAVACRTSGALDILGGIDPRFQPRADEHACALGSIRLLTFGTDAGDQPVSLSSVAADELRDRLFLVYSGRARPAGPLHQRVWSRYRDDEPGVAPLLAEMRRLAGEMTEALTQNDLDALGELVGEHWAYQRKLIPEITDDRIDNIISLAARNGSAGAKALGAGSGGSVLLVARQGASERLRAALSKQGLRMIDFDFDSYGVYLEKVIE
jgi:galactokinase/mevalonate kinase-like predicted kinase